MIDIKQLAELKAAVCEIVEEASHRGRGRLDSDEWEERDNCELLSLIDAAFAKLKEDKR